MDYIIRFERLSMQDVKKVGGKNASMGEMIQNLTKLGVKIPTGFATTIDAYKEFLRENDLDPKIYQILNKLDVKNINALKKASKEIKSWILKAEFNENFKNAIIKSFKEISANKKLSFAVRSSANAEDSPEASFAGQQDSYLNVIGIENILLAIKKVFASLFNERSIVYRVQNHFVHDKVQISAGVQIMIRSDLAASGVIFTLDTETGFEKVVFINASYGLGESVVQGIVNPDEFFIYKPSIEQNKFAIIQRNLGSKATKVIYTKNTKFEKSTKTVKNIDKDKTKFCINDAEAELLTKYAILIQKHYGRHMDIEWAKDGVSKELYIVQSRPETVKSRELNRQVLDRFSLEKTGEVIVTGHSVGQKIGQGEACVITDPKKMHLMKPGRVLIADMTDPDWEPIMKLASAIVTNRGGRTCHAAIVARELGIPAVVGCPGATTKIKSGKPITVSCAGGDIGYVYSGLLPIKIEHIKIAQMPTLPFNLCVNLADPDSAFSTQFLPNSGVGLLRLEFIISNTIGLHPKALLKFSKLPKTLQNQIKKITSAYKSPIEFYIEKMREGVATIAAAFAPKPVLMRFSDFKSNEYANLLGGHLFEPKEENPMIGYRGGSRYVSELFADCFALECEAIKRVRDQMGLTNLKAMLPFVRTVDEAKKIIALMEKNGLKRGENGLEIILMCEIPSNALLAEEFLEICDGFSIGSNDLTQLTLGLDRDSNLVANLFDERNPAVKKLLHEAIATCNQMNKYIGICGQGPSDYPDFAEWLMNEGIKTISLNPDSIVGTWLYLAEKLKAKNNK